MVKCFALAASSLLLMLSACNVGNGTVEGCAAPLYGTYLGHSGGDGRIDALMMFDGSMEVLFLEPDDRMARVTVAEDGSFSTGGSGALQLNGTMDLDSCTASGDWQDLFDMESGTFEFGEYKAGF